MPRFFSDNQAVLERSTQKGTWERAGLRAMYIGRDVVRDVDEGLFENARVQKVKIVQQQKVL